MRFNMIVRDIGDTREWTEAQDRVEVRSLDQAQKWAEACLVRFNRTLRPHEKPRELVRVELLGEGAEHNWEKTNSITILDHRLVYDTYRCSACGITGRRYGLSPSIVRDDTYSAPSYADCRKAKKLRERYRK